MEALYSKLYNKYKKLKREKESELDKLNCDQEAKFMTYVAAADELIEHLTNEKDRLRALVNDLKSEVASIRSIRDEQHAEYQKLLMEENQKNKELKEEIEKLQSLKQGGPSHNARDQAVDNGQMETPGGFLVGSDPSNFSAIKMTCKRSRHSGADAEVIAMPTALYQPEHVPVGELGNELSKKTMCSGSSNIQQPECCRRNIASTGGDVNVTGPSSCLFQELVECLVGMKLSVSAETDGICVSALHQSSGYSFSLKWMNNSFGEVELLYRVLSLGTFERAAPEWMREVIMFSTNMCPIFFERVSRVIKLHH